MTLTVLEGLPDLLESDATNLVEGPKARATLSHSSLNAQLACTQLYAYEYVDKIEPIVQRASRRLGAAFAKALEAGDPAVGVRHLEENTVALGQQEVDQFRIDSAIVKAASGLYLATYTREEAREFGYRVRLRNPHTGAYSRTYDLEGYADGLVRTLRGWTLIEDKFVGQLTDLQIKKLPLDRQLALECYGIWRATGKPVTDVQYRFTRKPSIKQRKGETVDQFVERIATDYETRPDFYLREESFRRSSADLVRVEAELWQWADQRRQAEKARIYPRNSSRCVEFGGCPFMPLCIGDPDATSLYTAKKRSDRTPANQEDNA
jgi:hypothetical protein